MNQSLKLTALEPETLVRLLKQAGSRTISAETLAADIGLVRACTYHGNTRLDPLIECRQIYRLVATPRGSCRTHPVRIYKRQGCKQIHSPHVIGDLTSHQRFAEVQQQNGKPLWKNCNEEEMAKLCGLL